MIDMLKGFGPIPICPNCMSSLTKIGKYAADGYRCRKCGWEIIFSDNSNAIKEGDQKYKICQTGL